jgi:hypothetical protein
MKKLIYSITLLAIIGLNSPAHSQSIAGGRAFSLAVCDNNTIRAWGTKISGQLGNGTNTFSNTPVQTSGLCPVLFVDYVGEPLYVSVFPNPCNGKFTLALTGGKGIVEIFNMLGQQVYRFEIASQRSTIDLSKQPK